MKFTKRQQELLDLLRCEEGYDPDCQSLFDPCLNSSTANALIRRGLAHWDRRILVLTRAGEAAADQLRRDAGRETYPEVLQRLYGEGP